MSLAADDPRHGTANGYTNLDCRCTQCQKAWAAWFKAAKLRRKARLADDDPRHGLANTYTNHSCRCVACLAAWNAYYRNLRARRRSEVAS